MPGMSLLKSSLRGLYRMGDRDTIDFLLLHTSRGQITQILDHMELEDPVCLLGLWSGSYDFAAVNLAWLKSFRVSRKEIVGKNLRDIDIFHIGRDNALGLKGVRARYPDHKTFSSVCAELADDEEGDESCRSSPGQDSASEHNVIFCSSVWARSEDTPDSPEMERVFRPYAAVAEVMPFKGKTFDHPVAIIFRLKDVRHLEPSGEHSPRSPTKDPAKAKKILPVVDKDKIKDMFRPGIEHVDRPGERIRAQLLKMSKSWSALAPNEQARVIRLALQPKETVLDPTSKWMERWDLILFFAVIYIVVVTPVEIAFSSPKFDGLFFINRLVDVLFIIDMSFNFFLMYPDDSPGNKGRNLWVKDRRRIRKRYLTSWFFIDLISVLPFDIIGLIMHDQTVSQLKSMKIIRLLRLAKLIRVVRSSRLINRRLHQLDIKFAYTSLMKLAFTLITVSHWVACLWGLAGRMALDSYGEDAGWISAFRINKPSNTWDSPAELYLASLYWSIMTITSIGYGDITPMVWEELMVSVFSMSLGACTWAYIIGNACGILADLDPELSRFYQTLDRLNQMMRDRSLPNDLRRRVRAFVFQNRFSHRFSAYTEVTEQLSPQLQGEVAMTVAGKWLDLVWYLNDVEQLFKVELSKSLHVLTFAPKETIIHPDGPALFILERGVAARAGCVLAHGAFWGVDMIIDRVSLREVEVATALNHCSVFTLTRKMLDHTRQGFPRGDRRIAEAAKKITRIRVLRSVVEEFRQQVRRKRVDGSASRVSITFERSDEHRTSDFIDVFLAAKRYPSGGSPKHDDSNAGGAYGLENTDGDDSDEVGKVDEVGRKTNREHSHVGPLPSRDEKSSRQAAWRSGALARSLSSLESNFTNSSLDRQEDPEQKRKKPGDSPEDELRDLLLDTRGRLASLEDKVGSILGKLDAVLDHKCSFVHDVRNVADQPRSLSQL